MSPTTPTPDPLDLTGLTPEQLDERLAQIEAAQRAARAEAEARVKAQQARYEAGLLAWRRGFVDNAPARLDELNAESDGHRVAFEEAARAGDFLAAWSAYLARVESATVRGVAAGKLSSARSALEPEVSQPWVEYAPMLTEFLPEFLTFAGKGVGDRSRAQVAEEFGADPMFEDFAQ